MKNSGSLWFHITMGFIVLSLIVVIFMAGVITGFHTGTVSGTIIGESIGYEQGLNEGLEKGQIKGVEDSLDLLSKVCTEHLKFKLTQEPDAKEYYCISSQERFSNFQQMKVDFRSP